MTGDRQRADRKVVAGPTAACRPVGLLLVGASPEKTARANEPHSNVSVIAILPLPAPGLR
jgi:hypothetical protein